MSLGERGMEIVYDLHCGVAGSQLLAAPKLNSTSVKLRVPVYPDCSSIVLFR